MRKKTCVRPASTTACNTRLKALLRKPSLDEQAHQCNYSKRTALLLSGEILSWRPLRCGILLVIKRFARLVSRSPENSAEGNAHIHACEQSR